MLQEFSILLRNNILQLDQVLKIIAKNNIDIRALCIAESIEYSILRVIFDDAKLANEVLLNNKFIFNINNVLAILVKDKPGELEKIINVFNNLNINIKYAYQIQSKTNGFNCLIINAIDIENAEKSLIDIGLVKLLSIEEI